MAGELTIKGQFNIDSPAAMVQMSKVLKRHIVEQQLFTAIVGKNYAHVEGWQFAGGLMGIYPKVVKVENLSTGTEKKWKADVEIIRMKDSIVVGFGTAICSNAEAKKKSFDEYAVLSMAQTRAIGKAYRNLIGWVMKLAGYEGTPSEEMFKMGDVPPMQQAQAVADDDGYVCSVGRHDPISKQEYDYSKRMYGRALCRDHQAEAKARK